MNIEKAEKLLASLDTSPVEFNYNFWGMVPGTYGVYNLSTPEDLKKNVDSCGTAACLAGHTVLLFDSCGGSICDAAVAELDLDEVEKEFLFYWDSGSATVEDAKDRLKWLIEGNTPFEYEKDLDGETFEDYWIWINDA